MKGTSDNLLGSIGELTEVASAKRGPLGDFSDEAMVDVSSEDTEEARGLVVMVTVFLTFLSLCGIALGDGS